MSDPRTHLLQARRNPYLRDIYDHTVHVINRWKRCDDRRTARHLSSKSATMNQEVRVLTVIA
jgi:Mg2+ and Co2+ transporter CorA